MAQDHARTAGKLIRKRRQVLGMTQTELATAVGVTRGAVSTWERGQHMPQRYQGKLEDVLGISLDEEPVLPPEVAAHQDDPGVMEIWNLTRPDPAFKLRAIRDYLNDQARRSALAVAAAS